MLVDVEPFALRLGRRTKPDGLVESEEQEQRDTTRPAQGHPNRPELGHDLVGEDELAGLRHRGGVIDPPLAARFATKAVPIAPMMPPIQWTPNTSRLSS